MNKVSLIDAFEVKNTPFKVNNISDYEIFTDKDLLDQLRTRILEDLIDENIPEDKLLEKGVVRYEDLFSQRNLALLSKIFEAILKEKKKGNRNSLRPFSR